ncbi:hypothetical protein B0H14DRAFT_2719000 [Mycena olivaceomarginata]|nr:hypothetical protein B0H14DRAFT_2719000 [Mycena olivaceomarginata]
MGGHSARRKTIFVAQVLTTICSSVFSRHDWFGIPWYEESGTIADAHMIERMWRTCMLMAVANATIVLKLNHPPASGRLSGLSSSVPSLSGWTRHFANRGAGKPLASYEFEQKGTFVAAELFSMFRS